MTSQPSRSPSSPSPPPGGFLLCACQGGAEAALKARMAHVLPAARPAAWRRGIVSFKLPPAEGSSAVGFAALPADLLERLVFARTAVHSLGQVTGADPVALADATIGLAGGTGFTNVHAWPRQVEAGLRGAESVAGAAVARRILLASCGLAGDLDPVPPAGRHLQLRPAPAVGIGGRELHVLPGTGPVGSGDRHHPQPRRSDSRGHPREDDRHPRPTDPGRLRGRRTGGEACPLHHLVREGRDDHEPVAGRRRHGRGIEEHHDRPQATASGHP